MSFFKTVTPLENTCLKIEMISGNTVVLDLSTKIESNRFCPLKEPDVFNSAAIDGDFIVFGSKVKIRATEIMNMVMLPSE